MNYQKYADKAYSKIKQYGSSVEIVRSGNKKYNPTTNKYEDETDSIYGFALQGNFTQDNIDGTNIRIGDVLLTCVLNGKPKSNDTVVFQGNSYTIINVNVFSPDGETVIYYKVQAR
jgi:hypothetical protein